jgi:uncharacterized protein
VNLTLTPPLYRIDPSLRLRRAIHASDPLLCARILKSYPSLLHNPDYSLLGLSNTSLHLASQLGYLSIVELLISLGHDTASSISLNEEHQTPLMLAAREGHTDVVHALCTSHCAGVERQDVRGRDAVMFACTGGHDTCLQILLTHAPEVPRSSTYFPAIPASAPSVVATSALGGTPAQRALLSHADVDGNTALHFASSNGHLLVLRTLLAAGSDPERRNVWSWTAVSYSATVAAEVYFRNLIAENSGKRRVRMEVERKGTGGGVRLVGKDVDGDEERSQPQNQGWGGMLLAGGA